MYFVIVLVRLLETWIRQYDMVVMALYPGLFYGTILNNCTILPTSRSSVAKMYFVIVLVRLLETWIRQYDMVVMALYPGLFYGTILNNCTINKIAEQLFYHSIRFIYCSTLNNIAAFYNS